MSLTADEVNILVYRYLEESGFTHTAFSFVAESQITKSPTAKVNLPPGALLSFLQKGLQYTEIEAHLNDDGTVVPFESEFSLLTPYLPKGGLAPQKASSTKRKFGAGRKKGGRNNSDANFSPAFNPAVSEAATIPLTGHTGPVYHCIWNPTRSMIASGSEDATVRVWNLPSLANHGRCSRQQGGAISASAISLDHRPSSSRNSKDADRESAEAQTVIASPQGSRASVTVIDWSPDGSRLATGCHDGPVRIWDLQPDGVSVKFAIALPRKAGPILALRWSPDGRLLAGGSDAEGGVTVWSSSDGAVVRRYSVHTRLVSDLCWMSVPVADATADADRLTRYRFATCSAEEVIHVFSLQSSEPLASLRDHSGEVNSLEWCPDGKRLLSASDDRTARVWNLTSLRKSSHNEAVVLRGHRKEVYSARWSPRKQDLSVFKHKHDREEPSDSASGDSKSDMSSQVHEYIVATASFDHALKLWDPRNGRCLRTLTRHSSHVYSIAFSPNGMYLASGSYDSELLVWSVATGTVLLSYVHGHSTAHGSKGIFDVRWNAAGDKLAASFADNTIAVLDFDGESKATALSSGSKDQSSSSSDVVPIVKRSRGDR